MTVKSLFNHIKSPGPMAFLAIVSFVFALYQQFYEKRPELQLKTEAVSSVFNVLQPIGGLQVFYSGQDLRNTKQSLWVISASFTNTGSAVIRKADYDDSVLFGLVVTGGSVVETPIISSDSKYLIENVRPKMSQDKVIFSPVIIEPQESFRIRLLVLGAEGSTPSITGLAKIAGLQRIDHVTPERPESEKTFLKQVVDAESLWVQLLRVPVYGLGGLIVFSLFMLSIGATVFVPIVKAQDFFEKQKRQKKIAAFKPTQAPDWLSRSMAEFYIEMGDSAVLEIKRTLNQCAERSQMINVFDKYESLTTGSSPDVISDMLKNQHSFKGYWMLSRLEELEAIRFDGIRPVVHQYLDQLVTDMAEYLNIDLNNAKKISDIIRANTHVSEEDSEQGKV